MEIFCRTMRGMKNTKPKPTPANPLAHALSVEGSQRKLADAIGMSPSAINHWITRGLPASWSDKLRKLYGRRKPKTVQRHGVEV